MKLTANFSLAEMLESGTARRKGLQEQFDPPSEIISSLQLLCIHILQPLRDHVGPISISSGYRCPRLNKAVKGAKNSQHLKGEAADIQAVGDMTNKMLFDAIKSLNLPYTQLLWEYGTIRNPAWVHVSYTPNVPPKRQILYIGV
jgi:zinc D-Ala-D-Ala carboxypeptidase